jgi:hypothetical protein
MPKMIGPESLGVVGARVELGVDIQLNPGVDRRSDAPQRSGLGVRLGGANCDLTGERDQADAAR